MDIDNLSTRSEDLAKLVEAVWDCLDDMRTSGRCVCGLSHAKLRLAFEPFLTPDGCNDDLLPLDLAEAMIRDAG